MKTIQELEKIVSEHTDTDALDSLRTTLENFGVKVLSEEMAYQEILECIVYDIIKVKK